MLDLGFFFSCFVENLKGPFGEELTSFSSILEGKKKEINSAKA